MQLYNNIHTNSRQGRQTHTQTYTHMIVTVEIKIIIQKQLLTDKNPKYYLSYGK